jgi:hypothetical protein
MHVASLPRLGATGLEQKMTKTKTITLTNEFHNTEANVRPVEIAEGRYKGYHMVSKSTARRLRNTLCGVSGCTCGGNFGERGGAYLQVVNEDYDGNYIIDMRGSHV